MAKEYPFISNKELNYIRYLLRGKNIEMKGIEPFDAISSSTSGITTLKTKIVYYGKFTYCHSFATPATTFLQLSNYNGTANIFIGQIQLGAGTTGFGAYLLTDKILFGRVAIATGSWYFRGFKITY
jgi:hypothetical protein